MFDKEYSFRGSHAVKVNELTAQFDKEGNKLFNRNYDVYLIAPVVGFIYGKKSDIDKTSDKSNESAKIFPETLFKYKEDLLFHYRLIMLLDHDNEANFDERVNKAFRYYESPEAINDEMIYNQYVLGGVDIIYDKIFGNANGPNAYVQNMYLFVQEIEERYNSKINKGTISDLCKLAKD